MAVADILRAGGFGLIDVYHKESDNQTVFQMHERKERRNKSLTDVN